MACRPGSWFGWPTSPRLEELRDEWIEATDLAAQKRIAAEIQLQAWQDVPYVPLGQIVQKTAFRRNVTGVLSGFAKFYDVEKT
jgi:peptide/nickel transport system substrate-binding protein